MSDPQLQAKMEQSLEPPSYAALVSVIEDMVAYHCLYNTDLFYSEDPPDQEAMRLLARLWKLTITSDLSHCYGGGIDAKQMPKE